MNHNRSPLKLGELHLLSDLTNMTSAEGYNETCRLSVLGGQFIAHPCSRGTQLLLLISNLNSQLF